MIDENGERIRGRAMIEAVFKSLFAERPGATITIFPESLRFPRARAWRKRKAGPSSRSARSPLRPDITRLPTSSWWTAGAMPGSARSESGASATVSGSRSWRWLVGDWTDESPDSVVTVGCRWTDDGNFLLREFTVRVQGKSVMTVLERIGWDPATRQVMSWVFDSEGGHGTGLWSRNGNEWVIKSTGVMPDGRIATATHILSPRRPAIRTMAVGRTDRRRSRRARSGRIPDGPPAAEA